MRTTIGFLGLLILTGCLGMFNAQQPDNSDACKFNVRGDPVHATVTGPGDIVKLVHIVDQPDSPIEIVSVDVEGMWLSVSGEQHTERDCPQYRVRNRSDRTIEHFNVELMVGGTGGAGGARTNSASPLAPGETVQIKACGVGGHGGARGNHVRVLVSVHSVDFGSCFYRPSLRIPRNLGVTPIG